MTTFVICGNGNIDILGGRVGVAKADDRNVHVGCFFDSLCVGPRIGDNDEAGFFERSGDVVREVTGGKATCDGRCSGMCSKFKDCSLAIRTSRDDTDVGWIVDSNDDTGGEDDLLPVCV